MVPNGSPSPSVPMMIASRSSCFRIGESSGMDLSALTGNMDLSFKVNLPNAAISSNATNKENDNKDLTWKLNANGSQTIEFAFELDANAKSDSNLILYIGIGVGVLLVLVLLSPAVYPPAPNVIDDSAILIFL